MSLDVDAAMAGAQFELHTEPVTTQQLVRYAGASDDYNRIHYDLPYAQAAGLGGVIAHGMLTMAFMTRAVTDWIGPRGSVQRVSARFTAPVRPGDAVHVVGEIIRSTRTGGGVRVECRLIADVAGRPVLAGEATALLAPE